MGAAEDVSRLALRLHAAPDEQSLLQALVDGVPELLPAAPAVAVVLLGARGSRPGPSTGFPDSDGDLLQAARPWSPLAEAAAGGPGVCTSDVRADPRWPGVAGPAVDGGTRSFLCAPLWTGVMSLGLVVLGSPAVGAFDAGAEQVLQAVATHAGIGLHCRRQAANLHQAVVNRDVIGQAKGILMERLKVPADEAFARLVQASQRTNRKLADVAEELAKTGHLRTGGQGA